MSSGTKIFVGNLSYSMHDEDLKEFFTKYGNVLTAEISRHQDSMRSRGFGYVTFDDESDANSAIEKCNGLEVEGRTIRVEKSVPRDQREGYDRPRRGYNRDDNYRGSRSGGGGYRGRDDSRGGQYRDSRPRYDGDRPRYDNDRPRYNSDRPRYDRDGGSGSSRYQGEGSDRNYRRD